MAKKTSPQKAKNESTAKRKTWWNLFDRSQTWDDKDEVLDAVYWFKQVLSIIMGVIWGYLGLKGFVGTISFAVINSLIAYSTANNTGYDFDADETLLSVKEGFMATFATFLVSWIVTYTAVHFGET